jgi:N-acetylneuraminic acid mutarotase
LRTKIAIVCILTAVCLLAPNLVLVNLGLAADMPSPSWRIKTSMPTARGQAAVTTGNNGLIYVMGGSAGSDPPMTTVQAYDPLTDTWMSKTALFQATRGAAVAKGLDGIIYVISGYYSDDLPDMQAYNTTSNSWTAKAHIPVPVWMAAATTGDDGKIYVFGGESSGYPINKTQVYNPATDTWTNGTDMLTARDLLGAVKGPDGLIYVMGGHNGTTAVSTVDAYNPSTHSWTTRASMPSPKLEFGIVQGPDNNIYVIGGGTDYGNDSPPFFDTVEIYNPRTDTWTIPSWSESLLHTPRKELGAALGLNGRIYAIGGASGSYVKTNEEALIVLPQNVPSTAYIDSITPDPATVNDSIMFVGHGIDPDGSIIGYEWRSSINGVINTSATFNITTLSNGTHTIYFSVQDNSGAWSPEVTATVTVNKPLADDPLYQKLLDLNAQIGNLREQNANLTDTTSDLTKKVDMLTMELLGTSAVTIILVLALIAVVFMNKRKPPPATSPAA